MSVFTKEDLKRFQAESLDDKYQRTLAKVSEWFARWNDEVYVSFSGGKDSTVLADICARWCAIVNTPLYLVFVDTGLEYPEIRHHVKDFAQWLRDKYNIEVVLDILRPEMQFHEVIKRYGYPIISKEISECVSQGRSALERGDGVYNYRLLKLQGKALDKEGRPSLYNKQKYEPLLYTDFLCSHECCNVMKKKPAKQYAKHTGRKPITAQMAEESNLRTQQWLKNGCNGFKMKSPISNPMSFWTEQDVLQYIFEENLPIAPVYGEVVHIDNKFITTGCNRTGCMFCAFGCHLEKSPSRFEKLKETHPRQYEYCIGGGEYAWSAKIKTAKRWKIFDFKKSNGEKMTPEEIEEYVQTHSSDERYKFTKVWMPNKQGLGLGHVFDELNQLYGDNFVAYKGGNNERT